MNLYEHGKRNGFSGSGRGHCNHPFYRFIGCYGFCYLFCGYSLWKADMEGEPSIIKLANSWILINVGGGPTEDKPEISLDIQGDPKRVSHS